MFKMKRQEQQQNCVYVVFCWCFFGLFFFFYPCRGLHIIISMWLFLLASLATLLESFFVARFLNFRLA